MEEVWFFNGKKSKKKKGAIRKFLSHCKQRYSSKKACENHESKNLPCCEGNKNKQNDTAL